MPESASHLLVPVDFRPASREAMRVALDLASVSLARVTLLHVVAEEALTGLDAVGYLHRASRWLNAGRPTAGGDQPDEMLDRLCRDLHPEWRGAVRIETAVRRGDVADEIARFAHEADAEWLVVGVNRRGWRLPLFRPRTSERIARRTTRSVLMVHPGRGGRCRRARPQPAC